LFDACFPSIQPDSAFHTIGCLQQRLFRHVLRSLFL
jgi:hypothetical protein